MEDPFPSSKSSSGSEDSGDDEPPPVKRPKLSKEVCKFATDTPLKNDKRKSLTSLFPLPAVDAAHPPKLDRGIIPIVPKTAQTNDRFLSKLQQVSMDSLGPLLALLGQAKKGKLTAKELVAPLEAAIKLKGNAAAHLSVERRKSLMKYLNRDLKPLAEGYLSRQRSPVVWG